MTSGDDGGHDICVIRIGTYSGTWVLMGNSFGNARRVLKMMSAQWTASYLKMRGAGFDEFSSQQIPRSDCTPASVEGNVSQRGQSNLTYFPKRPWLYKLLFNSQLFSIWLISAPIHWTCSLQSPISF